MGEDEVYEIIPVAGFEDVCSTCYLVYPKAAGCECDEWADDAQVLAFPRAVAA